MRKEALIVFAKVPEPGQVKTRLTAVLTPAEAAGLYAAFLRDALAQYAALEVDLRLYLDPPGGAVPDEWLPPGTPVLPQRGRGLGARMQRAFLETFVAGYERIAIIGTDHPTLPSAFIEAAFAALAEPRTVVIGPSEDGGYYLLGMNVFYPEPFEEMTYSHPGVFAQTLERIARTPATPVILPGWYDVDTPEALLRLAGELEVATPALRHTRHMLRRLQKKLEARTG
ncbi:TIGR04282 family arsenosugar biosynthesis glycosyltransferase [Rhodocaloribacter litoris]|uniref:TIGR04282 family arsenosugar biosynthesis glycosyltransferase n=1 Tax=Rhodocaloribacter litoris TaxID=2558931 RepID=UPI00142470EB|nr:TIGR04282 family arsenosugar biosynthesis glycosyltransferase [Rhodocaloribacter litoris]QXD15330.1 TIGR04282 family arsenosugar biosynthesis glycosyltransferase [Rhodocaloribacter litoris]